MIYNVIIFIQDDDDDEEEELPKEEVEPFLSAFLQSSVPDDMFADIRCSLLLFSFSVYLNLIDVLIIIHLIKINFTLQLLIYNY